MMNQQFRKRSKNRTELTIVSEILKIIKNEVNGLILHDIITKASLDHDKALELLERLKTSGIISEELGVVSRNHTRKRKTYKLTHNGYLFIDELEKFYAMLQKYNLEIKQ